MITRLKESWCNCLEKNKISCSSIFCSFSFKSSSFFLHLLVLLFKIILILNLPSSKRPVLVRDDHRVISGSGNAITRLRSLNPKSIPEPVLIPERELFYFPIPTPNGHPRGIRIFFLFNKIKLRIIFLIQIHMINHNI